MAKGAEAKELVSISIQELFGQNFLGIQDKKLYILSEENGEPIQVAIQMTCPKVNFGGEVATREGGSVIEELSLSAEQKQNIENLLTKRNII